MTLFQLRKTIEAQTGKNLPASKVAEAIGVKKQQYWSYEQGVVPNVIVVREMWRYFQQWMPELTLEEMISIIEETSKQKEPAAAG
jgi:DNA-binding XRE family transcriptional regulator